MEQRPLGRTGFEVSRLILGCGGFGGMGSDHDLIGKGESDAEAAALMDAAWDLGITTFDTADAYAGGRSELAIGKWIRSRGRLPTLTTKTFHPMSPDGDRGLAPARIRRQVESSLRRLGVERIDLYLPHEPDGATPLDETLDAFDALVAEGKLGAYGGSHVTADLLSRADGRYAWLQNSFSLLDQVDEQEVLPRVEAAGLGYTPYSPLAGGWLTGKYERDEPPPRGSRMDIRPGPYLGLRRDDVWRGLDRLRSWSVDRGLAMTEVAYAWALGDPRVTAILVGPRNPDQLAEATRALELRLSDDDRRELAGFFAPGPS
jgi:aryl-alcohol dehydrogenase-like predicted oxidoreductase